MKYLKLLTCTLVVGTALLFAGCGGHDHDHDGHDHSGHDHDHDHAHGTADKDPKAAKSGAITIIEKPSLEQLAKAKEYPLETCLVTDEKLGSMGKPYVVVVGDQQVKLCCDGCLDDLKKDAATLLTKLAKPQAPTAP